MEVNFQNGKCEVILNETVDKDKFEKVLDLKKLGNAIKGLELLGKKVTAVTLAPFALCADMETPYYKKLFE